MTRSNTQAPDQADRQAMVSRLCAELPHVDRIEKEADLSAETVKAMTALSEALLAGILALKREGTP
jgi:predicted transposase YdaD